MKSYEYRHVIAFEETNLIGNVYYVNHLKWQGRCRELFLREAAPMLLEEIKNGLCFVTAHCSCDFFAELSAFDEVAVRLSLKEFRPQKMVMHFDYYRLKGNDEELVARGEQHVVCMRRTDDGMVSTPFPEPLLNALKPYMAGA